MADKMILRKIRMINFRGFKDKTISFNDKPIILLSAANGVGKTTTIDAIEWCLTGNIGRLKNAFDTRSTNDTDRKMNTKGILKNKDAGEREKVKVTLWVSNEGTETILCREQSKDELNPALSKATIDKSEEAAKAFIREYVGDSFYNYHFCDVQKSFNVQSKKRKELVDFFGEFITNYDAQKQVAENLDIFAEDVDRYIEDCNNQRIKPELIENIEEQLSKVRDEAEQVPYPEVIFYPEENTKIASLTKVELKKQKEKIEKCGYHFAMEVLSKIVENESLKSTQSILKEIVNYWEKQGENIRRAEDVGLGTSKYVIRDLENKLKKINELRLTKYTIIRDGELVVALKNDSFSEADFVRQKEEINKKENKVKKLSEEIELLSHNNKLLQVLSNLTANKQTVIEYRNSASRDKGYVRCPVCGSEVFGTMDEESILLEAEEYIKRNGESVKLKEKEKVSLQTDIDASYQRIIDRVKDVVEQEKIKLKMAINELNTLYEKVQPYFDLTKKLPQNMKKVSEEGLTAEEARELLADTEGKIFEDSKEAKLRESYKQILRVLGYDFENENVQQTYEKVKIFTADLLEISNFSYNVFVSKINAIDHILANQTLFELNQKLEKYNNTNKEINDRVEELTKLQFNATMRATNIRRIIDELSREEYEKVGPALCKFYNKLSRVNVSDGIRIIQQNEGISIVDAKGKNIVNILSNGQISVFMLAHFFAGINVRNAREKTKIYFIDDLTACMDDVNMLAFMDLLKYQMTTKATMEQLFFITCDERISKLLKYKMSGRGIEICELLESDIA